MSGLYKVLLTYALIACVSITFSMVCTFIVKYKSHENQEVTMLVNEDIINVLIVGLDYEPEEWPPNLPFSEVSYYELRSHSDVIILASIQPDRNKVNILSIPRDTLIEYNDKSTKINYTFASGGITNLIKTVEKHLYLTIHHFALIDFQGFERLIDVFDGIEIELDDDIKSSDGRVLFERGKQTLDGAQSLKLVRHRMGDPMGDIGRIGRQQLFVEAFHNKVKSASVNTIIEAVYVGHKIVKTDMTPLRVIALARIIMEHSPLFNYYTLPGKHLPPHDWWIDYECYEKDIFPQFR